MPESKVKQMKSMLWLGAVVFAVAIATSASAQVNIDISGPPVPGFSNYYPWFNDVPQYSGEQSFRWFLAHHPNVARELARNPALLYDANWRRQHPQLEQYFATHPQVWAMLNGDYWATGPAETQWGDYDDQHQWRDAYWWHEYDPDRFYDSHPDWVSLDPRWRDHDGDYDQSHVWHYKPQNRTNQANQQQDRERQASREQQQRNDQQHQQSEQQDRQRQQQQNQQNEQATREQQQNQQKQRQNQQEQSMREQPQRGAESQPSAERQPAPEKQQQAAREQKPKSEPATNDQGHQQQPGDQPQDKHGPGNDKP